MVWGALQCRPQGRENIDHRTPRNARTTGLSAGRWEWRNKKAVMLDAEKTILVS